MRREGRKPKRIALASRSGERTVEQDFRATAANPFADDAAGKMDGKFRLFEKDDQVFSPGSKNLGSKALGPRRSP